MQFRILINLTVLLVLATSVILFVPFSHAQKSDLNVALTYTITDDNVLFGDIISYDKKNGVYSLSRKVGDEDIFGITVENPVLVLRTETNKIPVVRSGQVLVNVTLEGGPIQPGDNITSSDVPGKGQKVVKKDSYILGVALEPFDEKTEGVKTEIIDGKNIVTGSIKVLLDVGIAASDSSTDKSIPFLNELVSNSEGGKVGIFGGIEDETKVNIIKYIIAALIAFGAIFAAFKNFMSAVDRSIISIGRNPLAKSSVWSVIILNSIVALMIGVVGIFISVIIVIF